VRVLIAVADVGAGVQLEEALGQAGFEASWDAASVNGPVGGMPEVVVVDGDHLGARLPDVANQWRDHLSVPGVVALGSSAAAREAAPRARVTLLAPGVSPGTLASAIREAAKMRLASGMRWPVLRAALKLPPAANDPSAWAATVLHARNADIDIARTALRWHVQHYATPTPVLDQIREERILTVPELETAAHITGTLTVQSLVRVGPLEPGPSARLLWALTCMGAVEMTPEIRDVGTPARRAVEEIRTHLRGRLARLARGTYFDVLEITPLAEYDEIEAACQLVAMRYAPQVLDRYDLADLAQHVQPIWEQIEKARGTLVDHAARGHYMDWLRAHLSEVTTLWAIEQAASKAAAEAFARGQRSLGEGDAHRAMNDFAFACRHHPGHPDYEANLAWVRFRVQIAAGKDQRTEAAAERKNVERHLLGCRPWPRALVALAMLCAAGGDADAARWHLAVALKIDPNVPAAAALAQRLGLRR
jgi:hypothetical protein